MRCDLQPTGRHDGEQEEYACTRCTQTAWLSVPVESFRMQCGAGPTIARKAFNFALALAKHAGDGFAKRSSGEIHELLETHCRPCKFFAGDSCQHVKCGCGVGSAETFFNKLAWASEHCPEGKW